MSHRARLKKLEKLAAEVFAQQEPLRRIVPVVVSTREQIAELNRRLPDHRLPKLPPETKSVDFDDLIKLLDAEEAATSPA